LPDVGVYCIGERIAGHPPGFLDGGENGLDDGGDMAGGLVAVEGGGHSTAAGMAQDDHQGHPQMLHGVLYAPQRDIIRHMAGRADNKEVPQPLVKDDLRGDARIGAGQDGGEGVLAGEDLLPARGVLVGMDGLTGGEAPVPLPQGLKGLLSMEGGLFH